MTRRFKVLRIEDKGRDLGKQFFIMEMSARKAERFALRAWFLMAKAGLNIPDDLRQSGWQGLALLGLSGLAYGVPFEEAEPLLDELLTCVRFIPDLKLFHFIPDLDIDQQQGIRQMVDTDTEEIGTLFQLRVEAFKVHTSFPEPGSQSTTEESDSTKTTMEPGSSQPQTYPQQSVPLSPRVRPRSRSSIPSTA